MNNLFNQQGQEIDVELPQSVKVERSRIMHNDRLYGGHYGVEIDEDIQSEYLRLIAKKT